MRSSAGAGKPREDRRRPRGKCAPAPRRAGGGRFAAAERGRSRAVARRIGPRARRRPDARERRAGRSARAPERGLPRGCAAPVGRARGRERGHGRRRLTPVRNHEPANEAEAEAGGIRAGAPEPVKRAGARCSSVMPGPSSTAWSSTSRPAGLAAIASGSDLECVGEQVVENLGFDPQRNEPVGNLTPRADLVSSPSPAARRRRR